MWRIGDFSRISGLTIKALRFYHDRGLLEPAYVDDQNGYRYYNAANLQTALVIARLREMDFPVESVAQILDGVRGSEDVLQHLEARKREIQDRMRRDEATLVAIDQTIQFEKQARANMKQQSYQIEEKDVEPVLVAGIRMKGNYNEIGKTFGKLGRAVGRFTMGKPLCLYYDGEYREEDADFEPCMPIRKSVAVDGVNVQELPSARCVTLIHQGPYDQIRQSYARLLEYMDEHDYEMALPTREVYVKGPGMILSGNPKKYLTEIQIPIA